VDRNGSFLELPRPRPS